MRVFKALLVALLATAAWSQQQPKHFSLTANGQCATISVQNESTVGIIVSGTWTGTLTPNLKILTTSGAPTGSTNVTPSNTTTPQATVTSAGSGTTQSFKVAVGGFTQFNLCFTAFTSGTAVVDLFSTTGLNAGLFGGGAAGGVTGTGLTLDNLISGAGSSAIKDSGIAAANAVQAVAPGAGVAHFAGGTQTVTGSPVVNTDITNGTIDLTTKVTGVLPPSNGGVASVSTTAQGYAMIPAGLFSTITAANTTVLSANAMRCIQFVQPFKITFTKVTVNVAASSNGNNFFIGIYDAIGTTLLRQATFPLTASTGIYTATVSSTTLNAGTYWECYGADNATVTTVAYFTNTATGLALLNSVTVKSGNSGSAISAGVMPASIGTITGATLNYTIAMLDN